MSGSSDAKWNALLGFSVAVIAASTYASFFWTKPVPAKDNSQHELHGLMAQNSQAQAQIVAAKKKLVADTWNVSLEALDSITLDKLNSLAAAEHLQLLGFITGRPLPFGQLQETPFRVHLEGGFMNVMAFVQKLENPESRLALDMLQIAAKDGATDEVAAEVGLVAFVGKGGQ